MSMRLSERKASLDCERSTCLSRADEFYGGSLITFGHGVFFGLLNTTVWTARFLVRLPVISTTHGVEVDLMLVGRINVIRLHPMV